MCSERQDVSSVLSQLHDKTDGWTNEYRWGRLITERCYLVIGRSQGTFVLFHFFTLFCFTIFYLWHSNKNLTEGKCILFGPESKHFKWRKDIYFLTLSSHRLLFNALPEISRDTFLKSPSYSWNQLQRILVRDNRQISLMPTSLLSLEESKVLLESRVHFGLFSSEMCTKSRAHELHF